MPQWRKLHAKIVESEDFNAMPDDFTRLLWTLLPLWLDSQGRASDSAALGKARLFPLREDVDTSRVRTALDWFAQHKMIMRYEVEGRRYFYVPTFSFYQGDTSREAKSLYPAPPEHVTQEDIVTQELVVSNSRVSREQAESRSSTDSDVDTDTDIFLSEGVPSERKAVPALASSEQETEPLDIPLLAEKPTSPAPPLVRKRTVLARKVEKAPKERDSRLDHPTIRAVRAVLDGRWPHKTQWDNIIKAFPTPPSQEVMQSCRAAWIEHGWNANALTWLFEWVPQGGPPARGNASPGNGHGHNGGNGVTPPTDAPLRQRKVRTYCSLLDKWEDTVIYGEPDEEPPSPPLRQTKGKILNPLTNQWEETIIYG